MKNNLVYRLYNYLNEEQSDLEKEFIKLLDIYAELNFENGENLSGSHDKIYQKKIGETKSKILAMFRKVQNKE